MQDTAAATKPTKLLSPKYVNISCPVKIPTPTIQEIIKQKTTNPFDLDKNLLNTINSMCFV